jgi:hypothetical protein
LNIYPYNDKPSASAILVGAQDWPNLIGYGETSRTLNIDRKAFRWSSHPVPTSWLSCLLTEEYWRDWITKYGSQALRFPQVCRSSRREDDLDAAEGLLDVKYVVGEMRPGLQALCSELERRQQLWNSLRPWYQTEFARWKVTPYSNTTFRHYLEKYQQARARGDEYIAQRAVISIIDFDRIRAGTLHAADWYWVVVAILM